MSYARIQAISEKLISEWAQSLNVKSSSSTSKAHDCAASAHYFVAIIYSQYVARRGTLWGGSGLPEMWLSGLQFIWPITGCLLLFIYWVARHTCRPEGLKLRCCPFWHQISNLWDGLRPVKKCIIGLVLCRAGKIISHLAPLSPNFTGVKSTKFGLHFRPQSTLKRSGFKTEQHIPVASLGRSGGGAPRVTPSTGWRPNESVFFADKFTRTLDKRLAGKTEWSVVTVVCRTTTKRRTSFEEDESKGDHFLR